MLRTFWLRNYRNVQLEENRPPRLGRINLLVGPNNSGKSNFIRAMGFLRDMLLCKGEPSAFLATVQEHGMAEALNRAEAAKAKGRHGSDPDIYFYWILESSVADPWSRFTNAHLPSDLTYFIGYDVSKSESFPKGFYIRHESIQRSTRQDYWKKPATDPHRFFEFFVDSMNEKARFRRWLMGSRPSSYPAQVAEMPVEHNETILKQTKSLLKDKEWVEKMFPAAEEAFEELLTFARGFRAYSSTNVDVQKMAEGAKIDLSVRALDAEGSQFVNVIRYLDQKYPDFLDEYTEKIRELEPRLKRLKVIDASDIYKQLELYIDGQKYKPREMSDGTLKAMWLALLLFSPDKGSVLSIDEPEMNLHPAWLKVIGGWLQRFISAEQLFVSTHSPDLLDAFTEGFKTGDVALFVFGLGDKAMRRVEPAELESYFKEGWELGDIYRSGVPQLGGWPW
jgi:predicted ATPase